MELLKVDSDSAHVRFPPPLMLLSCLAVGGILHFFYPVPFVSENFQIFGYVLIVAGLGIILFSASQFKKHHTNIEPWKTTSNIITTGIYSKTRNPIYLSFLIIHLGVAIAANSFWILALILVLFFLLTKFVIRKEEKYLEEKFDREYLSYKQNTRRWI